MRRIRFTIGSLLITVIVPRDRAHGASPIDRSLGQLCLHPDARNPADLNSLDDPRSRAATRAFWLGLALFGGVYFIFSLVSSIESRMATRRLLVYLDSEVGRGNARIWDPATGKVLGIVTNQNFLRIGHCILALFFGWCGGLLSRAIHDRSRLEQRNVR